ncbi:hypothetical protein BOTBODRAFT_126477 [Botryobasidium botryosum FD-172 SS1]|uniref:Fatty acid hydroxylase domain-containing protein n=1 Tax=Botryobasidium botryosum (strain FD-172 SS1) TaxID=930990 RepID=A0A067MV09_BOTB1|nr:hypothetical protein BOTBODRAFT_126477 [Botryobasidium botryosum FD-172 SS1]
MVNITVDYTLPPHLLSALVPDPVTAYPSYHINGPSIVSFLSDKSLSLLAPLIAYWAYSLFFHALDCSDWAWIDQYRIHESAEVQAKNRATRAEVVKAVVLQQIFQTTLGVLTIEPEGPLDHVKEMRSLAPRIAYFVMKALGQDIGKSLLVSQGESIVYFVYWWAIPIVQFVLAFAVIDTWQYFFHRLFHINKFLYKHIHSVHHRLYVPYAFGALYNHWFEGLLLDSIGATIAHTVTGMTSRQTFLLFTFATLKTVDDHCGYALPFDPFQVLFPNNAKYHDIHHRTWGIKTNFSQPFYIHWDVLFGTRYDGPSPTRGEKPKKQ